MNRVLSEKLAEYLRLNELGVNEVFNKYGLPQSVKISVESVVSAYQVFGGLFAADVFEALYPVMKSKMAQPQFSNADGVGAESMTDKNDIVEKNNFWTGFANVLNGLVAALPAVTDSVTQIKYGHQPSPAQPQPLYAQPQGFNNSILIYLGLGFVALLALIIVFKKMK